MVNMEQAFVQKSTVEIFTDGACSGNPGPGGWGVIVRAENGEEKEFSGGEVNTTNNRMELIAAIKGLETLKVPVFVKIYTDSQYLQNGMKVWLAKWKNNGWKTAGRDDVKNMDLWQRLDGLASQYEIEWHWIKGHSGHAENDRADILARNAIVQIMMSQENKP
jgi:ribonuclease HI